MSKILFVHLLNDYSGSPKVLQQVIRTVQNAGREMILLSGNKENGFLSGFDRNHYVYNYKRFNNKYLTLFSYLYSQVNLFRFVFQLRKEISYIYINTFLPFGAAIAGKLLGKPVIYHIHETTINPPLLKFFLRYIVGITAQKIIFVSDFLLGKESFSNISQYTIYNTLPAEFLENVDSLTSKRLDQAAAFNVLMIASLKVYKGLYQLIEIAKACEKHPHIEFSLVLNADEFHISDFFSDTALPSNLKIYSKQENVHPFYQRANLVLNLTIPEYCIESFGLTILEAFAYGLPVVGPPAGGPAEIIRDEIDGFLISSLDVNGIANKILSLSQDKAKYEYHSNNAFSRWQYFDKSSQSDKVLDLFI